MTSWRAESFDLLPQTVQQRWASYGDWPDGGHFAAMLGIEVEELRRDYARMRLPWRSELNQTSGLMHGGAIATLIDTVVVPAVGQAYDAGWAYFTIGMNIRYIGAVVQQDAVAEGWIEQRGRTMVFCRAEVRTPDGKLAADGTLTYTVRPPRA